MRNLFFLLVAAVGVAVVAPAPAYARDDDDDKPTKAPVNQANLSRAFISEIKALTEAETMLKTISDEKSAKAVKVKLMHKFSLLRPINGGTEEQLMELARAQNRVSAVMWDLKKEPYFETADLQQLWTVMTHHYARRSAGAR